MTSLLPVYMLLLASAVNAQPAQADNSALQAACVNKVKPTLNGVERIRDIGVAKGKFEQDVTFAVSANGGKTKVITCQVQPDGTLRLLNRGTVSK